MNRPRIFLSAVSQELRAARQAVAASVRTLGYDPVSQDDFPTGHGELRQWLCAQIDGGEGLIQLVGHAYGAEPPEVDPGYGRISYTQLEFLYASRRSKKTWVIVIGEQFHRDAPVDRLDLPHEAAHPDPDGYQTERRKLQQDYLTRLRRDNHLWYSAQNNTELENIILRLRDELGELRRQWEQWLMQDADFKAHTTGRLDELAETVRLASVVVNSNRVKKSPQPLEPDMALVPAGEFLIGHPPGDGIPEHETPQHTLYLPDFHIGRYPVTNRQYQAFIKAAGSQDIPAHWQLRQPPANQLDHPVSGVSWEDARAYCAWLSEQIGRRCHLPSEAEWEKAARGSQCPTYPWGEEWQDGLCNAASEHTTPVDAFPKGASEYGCKDLLGNLQEWPLTRWGPDPGDSAFPYPYDPADGREDPDPGRGRSYRIHRGGYWKNRPDQLRCSARGYSTTDSRVPWRGFRVLLESD